MPSKFLNNNMDFVVMLIVVGIALVPLVYGVVVYAASGDSADPPGFIEKPDPKFTKCIQGFSREYMSLNHMDLLKEIRLDSVREGKRGAIKLNDCRECHTSREKFCDKCHNVVNLDLDCFDCHYYPK
ncbi:MAG: hypothetical protein ACYTHM_06370 [Planctomycetota bacterium]|jgi:hypothetical protein